MTTNRLSLTQITTVQQLLQIDLDTLIPFWTHRITELAELIGMPSKLAEQMLRKMPYDDVKKLLLEEESTMLDRVIELMRVIMKGEYSASTQASKVFSVLEVGCGVGAFTERLAALEKEGVVVTDAVDMTPSALELTKRRLISKGYKKTASRVYQGVASMLTKKVQHDLITAQKIYTKSEQFDFIIFGRIGHRLLDAWDLAFCEAYKLLNRDGYFIIFEPMDDYNHNQLMSGNESNVRTFAEYERLLVKKLKMKNYAIIPMRVFEQTYVLTAFTKISR